MSPRSSFTAVAIIAVTGILFLQRSDAIPPESVGGSLVIGLAFLAGALATGVHEAWTRGRGVVGWIVNIVVSLVGAFVTAPIAGACLALLLSDGSRSLAATGGFRYSLALVGGMVVALLTAKGALSIVNRWRTRS